MEGGFWKKWGGGLENSSKLNKRWGWKLSPIINRLGEGGLA